MNRSFFTGRNVLVMGLGRFGGGVDAVRFASRAGASVTVTDLAGPEQLHKALEQLKPLNQVKYHLGSHRTEDFEQADIVIVNPAVPPDNDYLRLAGQLGKVVTSQVNIFFELCPALIVGITGANGKSTTSALTAHLLQAGLCHNGTGGGRVWLSGNIGNQPMLELIDQIKGDDIVVLELSSFQIEQLAQCQKAPHIALLTNLTPNHLDRYGSFDNYCAAKEGIFKYQRLEAASPAVSIFNGEDKIATEWFERYKGQQGRICIKFSCDDIVSEIRSCFSLPGHANLSNLAAAYAVAKYLGVDEKTVADCLPAFKPLPHRLELVAEINGVGWYNDSKATTPEAAIAALEAFDRPIVLIAGGYDKHTPFDRLGEQISRKAKAAILIGQTAGKIADAITGNGPNQVVVQVVDSLASAVERAEEIADAGDVVLLSPACASYDMFENYEQRGKEFISLVQRIAQAYKSG